MGIFDRMTDIFKSNVNDALDRMEDPEKMLKNMIIEMEEALTKATSALAKAIANEQNLRKQQGLAQQQAAQWEEKAALAMKAGNADLAKQALSKKITLSPIGRPFLVPPKQRTSTPARQVMSAGCTPSAATALAKRAPSICTFRSCCRARVARSRTSSTE